MKILNSAYTTSIEASWAVWRWFLVNQIAWFFFGSATCQNGIARSWCCSKVVVAVSQGREFSVFLAAVDAFVFFEGIHPICHGFRLTHVLFIGRRCRETASWVVAWRCSWRLEIGAPLGQNPAQPRILSKTTLCLYLRTFRARSSRG